MLFIHIITDISYYQSLLGFMLKLPCQVDNSTQICSMVLYYYLSSRFLSPTDLVKFLASLRGVLLSTTSIDNVT